MFKRGGMVWKKKQLGDLEMNGTVPETLVGGSGAYTENPTLPSTA